MELPYRVTRHARERSTAREIPPMVAEMIIEFGHSHDAGDGARKYALTKDGMRELRRFAGRSITKAVTPYLKRNAYVVAAGGRIITMAYAPSPLFY
ncbi:hypothetical protein [Methylocella tundrae]|uniref:hypothetical protein n=1 Tax=Methylocella tundrae TaxID=227605 RepID=UPI0030FEA1FE|nr:hypothetical protein SIN04_14640 [Methylocella tundrae]